MSAILAMMIFSLVMSLSPGPVNMVILSSGVHHGAKRTIPYVSGATIGFTLLLLAIGFGLYEILQTYPKILNFLAIGGSAYIIYIGYKIASSKPNITIQNKTAPKFYEGAILQWINPKAWIACVSGVSIFSSLDSATPLLLFCAIYFVICYLSLGVWAIAGDKLSALLTNQKRLKIFNLFMGVLLIATGCYTQITLL